MDAKDRAAQQTPAQWAVRWHGLVVGATLLLSVPLYHLTRHGLLGHDEPPIRLRTQTTMPEATRANVLDGSWMAALETNLREASPIVWWLRGTWNEALMRFGIVHTNRLHLGKDGWIFLQSTVQPNVQEFEDLAEARRRLLTRVRDRVRASGAELMVSVVPDKARIFPEFAFETGTLSATKQPIYGRILQELRDLDIPAIDLASGMTAARAAAPEHEFYYQRDTHWKPAGALIAAQAIAVHIETSPIAAKLQPHGKAEIIWNNRTTALSDLVSMLGLLTEEVETPDGKIRPRPASLFTASLAEPFEVYSVAIVDGGRRTSPFVENLDAEILLCGTSFTEVSGKDALALTLGRRFRVVTESGATGLRPMRKVLEGIRQGAKPKVVIWEIVERGFLEDGWLKTRF